MANSKISETADDVADTVAQAGQAAEAVARKAGNAARSASTRGAAEIRRSTRDSQTAYDDASDAFGERVGSLEESIRRNPLAAAGAALLLGVVLGRFVL